MFLLVSVRHVGTHPGEHQHGVSIVWVKHFFGYLVYEIFLWPESWRGSLYMYLLSFPRFWTLSIGRFWFWFLSILNCMTLKNEDRSTKYPNLENEAPKARKRSTKSRHSLVFIKDRPVSSLGFFVFEFLGSSFSRFGCFVLRSSFSSALFSKLPHKT